MRIKKASYFYEAFKPAFAKAMADAIKDRQRPDSYRDTLPGVILVPSALVGLSASWRIGPVPMAIGSYREGRGESHRYSHLKLLDDYHCPCPVSTKKMRIKKASYFYEAFKPAFAKAMADAIKDRQRLTLPGVILVPSALVGLTALFGMGRGDPHRYSHLNALVHGPWSIVHGSIYYGLLTIDYRLLISLTWM